MCVAKNASVEINLNSNSFISHMWVWLIIDYLSQFSFLLHRVIAHSVDILAHFTMKRDINTMINGRLGC